MDVCYAYVGIFRWWDLLTAEGQAAWLSAIGGLAAIALTASFYFLDRMRERALRRQELRRYEQEQDDSARARAHRAWQQSVLLLPIVHAGHNRLRQAAAVLSYTPSPLIGLTKTQRTYFELPHLDELRMHLTDPSAFDSVTERLLLEYLSHGNFLNAELAADIKRDADEAFNHPTVDPKSVWRRIESMINDVVEPLRKRLQDYESGRVESGGV